MNNLFSFITDLNTNLDKNDSKTKFDPFSVDNTNTVSELYKILCAYMLLSKDKTLCVPSQVIVKRNNVKCIFDDDFNEDLMADAITNKNVNSAIVSDQNTIEITKKKYHADVSIGGSR